MLLAMVEISALVALILALVGAAETYGIHILDGDLAHSVDFIQPGEEGIPIFKIIKST